MKKATENVDEIWEDKKSRYTRNLGLAYERAGELESAKEQYEKSVRYDMNDYKTWNNIGAIEIKLLEEKESIQKRDKTLDEFMPEVFKKYVTGLNKAVNACKTAIGIAPGFKDPYCKLIQLNTYLYLADDNRNRRVREAEGYIGIMNDIEYIGAGFLFAYRNYCEATGNMEKAREINNKIKPNDRNDVTHIGELYDRS